ncbi:LOW QUALITY PROTEIN: hypothetical protein U9M48_019402 [Paspalum notatum var. saurae]|uniref:Uncharacterized protein n=1 Tax=Paspalum notatum var. saurae TaxID=547442 RepID=A0AAQ3TDW0_PASNO
MGEFMKLRPTPFAGSHDPLEAYDRIKTIERKLEIINRSPGHSSTHRGKDWPGGKVTVKLTEGKLPGKGSRKTSANIMFRKPQEISRRRIQKPANTMTMQEYIEKFTTRPVMHRKKSTPILRSASASFGDQTLKSIHSNEAPSFAATISRVIRIEEDKARREKSAQKEVYGDQVPAPGTPFPSEKLWSASVTGLVWCAPKHYFEPVTLLPTQSSYRTRQYDPRTCFKCVNTGRHSVQLVLSEYDRRHPPSPTQ